MKLAQIIGTIAATEQYRRYRYRRMAEVAAALTGLLLVSTAGAWSISGKQDLYRYVLIENDGTVAAPVPLTQPNRSDEAVAAWASDAITRIYTFDFRNYRSQFQDSMRYLTHFGFKQFTDSLDQSGNFTSILSNKYVLTASPTGPAQILWKGPIPLETGGYRYGWKVEMPIMITYRSSVQDITQRLTIKATIGRMPERSTNGSGLGIRQILAQ